MDQVPVKEPEMVEPTAEQLVDGRYAIGDLVDIERLRRIFEQFTEATGFTAGFLDHPGMNILIATGWRDICTKYHRICPAAQANCRMSNHRLLDQLNEPGIVVVEACDNGLVDCATPIMVNGKHIASLATGQLLLEPPDLERFRRQAAEFGLDETEYLEALADIPVVSEEKLRRVTEFLGGMALIISELGYTNLIVRLEARHLGNEIAKRRQVEEGLRQSEEKYRFLTERIADILWTLDPGLRTTYVSPSVEKVLGFSQTELMNLSMEEMLTPDSVTIVNAKFASEMQIEREGTGAPDRTVTMEIEYCRKDGTTLWMENTMRFLRDHSGMMVGIHGVSRDISERRHADREKEALLAQLVQSQKMESIGRLAGGVAHDFNNMLTVILGQTELALLEVPPSAHLHDVLVEIRRAGERSADLTQKLLAFARKQVAAPRLINLDRTMGSMLGMLQRLIGDGVELVFTPGADTWPVKMDPGQIDRILANLCVNARDAISGVGRIGISTGNVVIDPQDCAGRPGLYPGCYVLITVADNGCGMGPEVLDHLFEPFFTTKKIGHGTGLGLATVYGIVKQNLGFIDAVSRPREGATFRIYLPRADEAVAEEDAPDAAVQEAPRGHSEVVLIVEDEELILELARTILGSLGYEVLAASTPAAALRIASGFSGEIHLLLSDMIMPGMNGMELAAGIRSIRPGLRCLFMSGYPADFITRSGFLESEARFVQKPFTLQDLATAVRDALDPPSAGCFQAPGASRGEE
jgi:PAS domain S-box-containing protein